MEPVSIERPSTWLKYKSGMCEGCFAGCCTLPVEVSAYDLMRLGVASEDDLAASPKKVARRLQKEGIVRSYHPSRGLFVLEQRNGRDCIYLNAKRQCTVYQKRPEVCRKFPSIGPRPGFCPKQDAARAVKAVKTSSVKK